MIKDRDRVPYCVGEYDSEDAACNGDSKAKNENDFKPCSWRNRCAAFQEHLRKMDESYEKYIELVLADGGNYSIPKHGRASFISTCIAYAKKYNVVDGIVIPKPDKKRVPFKKARRASVKRAKGKAKVRKRILDSLFEHFKTHFIENLETHAFTPPRGVVKPGRFYVVDRRKTSKYISVYCKQPGVFGVPVALIRFKPRTMTFDIELPVETLDYDGIDFETMKKIHPQVIDDGHFKSTCRGMNKEGVALVAQTIAKMVKKGKIKLPHPD